jgi:hypothetical protein
LLSNGAIINQVTKSGYSALALSAYSGQEDVVDFLIESGADINQADNDGDKPIDVAKTQKIKDMLVAHTKRQQEDEEQQNRSGKEVPKTMVDALQWFSAAKAGDLAVIEKGINDKIDVNCRDSKVLFFSFLFVWFGFIFIFVNITCFGFENVSFQLLNL